MFCYFSIMHVLLLRSLLPWWTNDFMRMTQLIWKGTVFLKETTGLCVVVGGMMTLSRPLLRDSKGQVYFCCCCDSPQCLPWGRPPATTALCLCRKTIKWDMSVTKSKKKKKCFFAHSAHFWQAFSVYISSWLWLKWIMHAPNSERVSDQKEDERTSTYKGCWWVSTCCSPAAAATALLQFYCSGLLWEPQTAARPP